MGQSFASFLLGDETTPTPQPSATTGGASTTSLSLQDEWRATSPTVSYGVRWERYPGSHEEHDRATSFNPNTPNPRRAVFRRADFRRHGRGQDREQHIRQRMGRLGASLGFAYEVNPKTVIRASGGIFYAPGMTPRIDATGFSATPSFSSPDSFSPVYNWANPWPQNWNRPPNLNPSFANGQALPPSFPERPGRADHHLDFRHSAAIDALHRRGSELHRQQFDSPGTGRQSDDVHECSESGISVARQPFESADHFGSRTDRRLYAAIRRFHVAAEYHRRSGFAKFSPVHQCHYALFA